MEYNGAVLGLMSCVFVLTIIMCIMSIISTLYISSYGSLKPDDCGCDGMLTGQPRTTIKPSIYTPGKDPWMPTNAYSSPGIKDGSDVPRYNLKDATKYQPSHSPPADRVMNVNKPVGFSNLEYVG